MREAYSRMHALGHAHSIEVLDGDGRLAGGLYGMALGRMFFGESMFSGRPGGSKIALAGLARRLRGWGWPLVDAQVESAHLVSLGAHAMPREEFLRAIAGLVDPPAPGSWTARFGRLPAAELAAT
jgi:leucyl/phenylalanyl-tRNA--protein transferase